jgi:hypothetical protein
VRQTIGLKVVKVAAGSSVMIREMSINTSWKSRPRPKERTGCIQLKSTHKQGNRPLLRCLEEMAILFGYSGRGAIKREQSSILSQGKNCEAIRWKRCEITVTQTCPLLDDIFLNTQLWSQGEPAASTRFVLITQQ